MPVQEFPWKFSLVHIQMKKNKNKNKGLTFFHKLNLFNLNLFILALYPLIFFCKISF